MLRTALRNVLAHKARLLTEQRAEGGVTMAGFMLARVSECMRPPLCMSADTTIAEAVAKLHESHADSLLVEGPDGVGMVTKTDLLNALVLKGLQKQSPLQAIANFELPETVRTYVLDGGTIGNANFVAVPYNAAHKAGALVVASGLAFLVDAVPRRPRRRRLVLYGHAFAGNARALLKLA